MDNLVLTRYNINQGLCILVIRNNETFGKLSVNILNTVPLEANEFWAKTWSENEFWATAMLNNGMFIPTDKVHDLGYVKARAYKLSPATIKQLFDLSYNRKTDIFDCNETLFALHEQYCES